MKKIGAIIVGVLLALLLLIVTVSDLINTDNKKYKPENQQEDLEGIKEEITKKPTKTPQKEVDSVELIQDEDEKIYEEEKEQAEEADIDTVSNISPTPKSETDIVVERVIKKREYIEVDINTIPYTNEKTEIECVVSAKNVFSNGKQLLYDIVLKPKDIENYKDEISYYVSYSSYNNFTLGEVCLLEIEVFENNIISVNTLKIIKN